MSNHIDLSDYIVSEKHVGHTKCKWIDDRDHDYLMDKFYKFIKETGPYVEIDFEGDGFLFEVIRDAIYELVDELARSVWGDKYGSMTYMAVNSAADHFMETIKERLQKEGYFKED